MPSSEIDPKLLIGLFLLSVATAVMFEVKGDHASAKVCLGALPLVAGALVWVYVSGRGG